MNTHNYKIIINSLGDIFYIDKDLCTFLDCKFNDLMYKSISKLVAGIKKETLLKLVVESASAIKVDPSQYNLSLDNKYPISLNIKKLNSSFCELRLELSLPNTVKYVDPLVQQFDYLYKNA